MTCTRTHITGPGRTDRGVSLVELMIALVLGLLLTAGVIQLFTGTRATYLANEGLARVQENGRFAIEYLREPLREANSRGFCGGEVPIHNHLRNDCSEITNLLFAENTAIAGWEHSGTAPGDDFEVTTLVPPGGSGQWQWRNLDGLLRTGLPPELDGHVVPGTDVLLVRRMVPVPNLTGEVDVNGANQQPLELNRASGIVPDAIVYVTNCTWADLFQNTASETAAEFNHQGGSCAAPGPGNLNENWSAVYNNDTQVFLPEIHAYFVGYSAAREEPGLYTMNLSRGTSSASAQELVEGVENLQLLYGYSLPGSAGGDGMTVHHWLPAHQVPDWGLITAVHVAMTVRSPENAGPGSADITFDLAGTDVTFAIDAMRLRQPVQSTIGLRNRYLVHSDT